MAESKLEAFVSQVEGIGFPHQQQTNEPIRCDSCSSIIRPNRFLSTWWSDKDALGNKKDLSMYRIHCEACTPPKNVWQTQYFSPKGWFEIVVAGKLSPEKTVEDTELLYYSTPNQGGNWTPEDVLAAAFPAGEKARLMAQDHDGPMDIIETLLYVQIDPRDIITDEGVRDLPTDQKQENLKRALDEFEHKADMERVAKYWDDFFGTEDNTIPSGVESDDL